MYVSLPISHRMSGLPLLPAPRDSKIGSFVGQRK